MKTHRFDGVSFFTGLVIAAIGAIYLIPADVSDVVDLFVDAGSWFWPVLLLAVGLAIVIPVLVPSHKRERAERDENLG